MQSRPLGQSLICPFLLLALVSGCQALHRYSPMPVLARDAETKKPIPGAEVQLTYPLTPSSRAPYDFSETTKENGIACLRVAPYGNDCIMVKATSKGYMSEEKEVPTQTAQALKPAHLFEAVEKRPVGLVLELYAEPRPTIELVVSTGYLGVVKAAVHVQEDAPSAPGQRLFSCVVPPDGVAQVTGPALLGRVFAADFSGKYADGTVLSREAKGAEIGLWWLKYEDDCHHFLVGTQKEFEAYRKSLEKEQSPRENRSGGGQRSGGTGGGHGRRGNQSSSGSGSDGMTP